MQLTKLLKLHQEMSLTKSKVYTSKSRTKEFKKEKSRSYRDKK